MAVVAYNLINKHTKKMIASELTNGQSYKVGATIYTYRGLLNGEKMTKANKLIFWIRESDEKSRVITDVAIRVDYFNKNIAQHTQTI